MAQAKQGDTVKVNYTGKFDDSTVFDTSEGREPLAFTICKGQVIRGFENAVVGLDIGGKVSVRLEPGDAYGEYKDNLVFTINREDLPEGIDPRVDQHFQMQNESGQELAALVIGTSEKDVTFDANHPMAGKALNFDIQLVAIS